MDTMQEERSDVLKVTDRCDRCESQAFVWVNGVNGDLLVAEQKEELEELFVMDHTMFQIQILQSMVRLTILR